MSFVDKSAILWIFLVLIGCSFSQDIDGGVSEWQEWGDVTCDQTCGVNVTGTRTRLRSCDNPLRQNNGKTCVEQGLVQQESSRILCDNISCGDPVDGAYGEWSSWLGECPTTCGLNVRYVQRRSRTCDSPKPQNGGLDCQGFHSEEKTSICDIPPCPDDIINGTYGEWGQWTADKCLLTCGVKVQTVERRNRSCDSPAPQNGGLPCQGPSIEARQIDCEGVAPCPDDIVDGGYGEWSQWAGATCTKTCGVGVTVNIYRKRSCDSPAPQNGGHSCNGTNYESTSMECPIPPCPDDVVDGGYSQWSQWTADPCPETCGVKIRNVLNRYRRCDSPVPLNGGKRCEGSNYQQKFDVCEGIPLCQGQVVNGSFSQWSEWTQTSCPETCGVDVETLQRRSRACDNPPPFNGGLACDGSTSQERNGKCTNLSPCPVDGGVSEWGEWDTPRCPTCGENVTGVSLRLRRCDNPVPANGGSFCIEPVQEIVVRSCEVARCPGDDDVGEWSQWSPAVCTATCGPGQEGSMERSRSCITPANNISCTAALTETQMGNCGLPKCPVDGGLSNWTPWSIVPCPVTCGVDAMTNQSRRRDCNAPALEAGDKNCTGPLTETSQTHCSVPPCSDTDGGVSEWQEWGDVTCDQTCGVNVTGTRTRLRSCDNPLRQGNGKTCVEQGLVQQESSRILCDNIPESCGIPVDGAYGEWSSWLGECPTTCGLNVRYIQRRNRTCDSPKPQNGGLDCQGSHSEEKTSPCDIPPCPDDIINGTYGEWGPWATDQCLLTCGVKVQTVERRNRSCDSPAPQNGGLPCQGPSTEARLIDCEGVAPCPDDIVDGAYREWSQWAGATCTKTCGVGVTVNIWRNRSCDSPAPQNGGLPCSGTNYESTSMECPIPQCPDDVVDGGYSQWSQWTADPCPETCGLRITKVLNRYRRCDSPVPLNGGKRCEGSYYQQKFDVCEGIPPCPGQVVNGSFSQWGEWTQTSCPETCGVDVETVQRRSRACDNPSPYNGGLPCDGSTFQERNGKCTNLSPCPVDGGMSEWGEWDTPRCLTCGENVTGVSLRLRPCDNPVPANGGSFCIEPVQEIVVRSCEVARCPGDDVVGEWSQWNPAACTATCGPGQEGSVERRRSCITPANNISCTAALTETRMGNCGLPKCPATTTTTPPTCGPMTDASLDEDCSNARCVAVNSSCVTTSAGSRRCACINKNVQISATECLLGPSVLSSTTNYVFSTDLSRTSVTVGSIMFDGLSTFPTNTFSIEGQVYPDEGILYIKRNSGYIDVALVKEISNAKTFVVALRATSGEFTVQQVVTVRITSSSFTPEDVTVMLVEGTRKGTLIADVRTIGSLGGYSNFEIETTDQTARALFNVTTSGQVLCGQDMFLIDFTNNDTVAKEYIFSVKATKGGQRETVATFYILLFKSTFTTTLRENWKGNILSYTITSSKFQVAIKDTFPDRLILSKDLMTISLVKEIDYDAGITSINFKLDLVTTTSTKSTTVDVHINIEDQNDERPKINETVYEFSLLAGSKRKSVVGVVDVTDGDTVGQTTFSLEGRHKDDFSINADGVLTSEVDLTRGRFPSAIPLRVKAYDGVSYSEEANITVYLISYTINAVNLNKTFNGRVSENSPGAFVANVAVSNHTGYKFANPQADRFFSLNSASGLVTTAIGLDRENDDQAYTAFSIQAYTDSGDQCSSVTIGQLITNITDLNDNTPEFSRPSYTGRVKENSIPGTLVVGLVDIAVTDEDTGVNGSVNFALTGPGKTHFVVEKLNHNKFTIKTSGTPIDREVTPYVVLTLTGTDNPSNPNTGTTTLNITIIDVNDNAPQFNNGTTELLVEENVGPKTITTLTSTDMDEGINAKVSYSLTDGGFGFFQIDESTGEVSTTKAIDREKRKVFNLIIKAKDQGSPSLESRLPITVNIRDVNDEKPAFENKYYKSNYMENSPCDRSILTVNATDQDEGSNAHIRFSTTSSNFTVDPTSGAIRCVMPLDYEEMQQHLIEIKAENPGFPNMSDTVIVEIKVEDQNDNPPRFNKTNYQSEITTFEWVTNNPVDVFEVTDDDSGTNGQFRFSMSGETDKFDIDGDTVGVLRIKEGASQPVASTTYNFYVTATDKGSPPLNVTVPVSVDVKKIQGTSTVRFSSKDFRFSIQEERIYTTSFGRANASHDASVSVRYTLIHGGDFHIDPSSGALTCSKALDRETAANHTMIVRARDPATNASDLAVITVQILDVNDNGPKFLASSGQLVFQVEENSPAKEIGRIIAKDVDADENGRITYSIESQTPRTHFSINNETGTVTVSGDLDREDYDTYNLTIKATDNGDAPRTATTSAKILVLDINDNPPTFQTTYAVTVKEDSAISASVETVSATDEDLAQHGAIAFVPNTVMVNGTVCPFNVSVETGVVKVSGDLDYETTSTYECIVTAVDMKGCSSCTGRLTGSATMSVTILDFNDNPPVFQGAPYQANVSRDANINTLVTDVITATDRDSVMDGNGVVTYHILSNISYFRIDRNSGKIYVATSLDKVNDDEVTLRIKATDLPQNDPAMEAITNITISILTDQPRPFFNKTYTFMLTENEKPDEDKVVSIRAYVRRASVEECNCTYDLIGSDNSSFYIDSMTGDLRQKDPIDREKTGNRFYVKVKATDRRSLQNRTTDVEVNVKDVNDNLPFFKNTQQNFTVHQSAPVGHVIGRVMSVDADELSHPIYRKVTDIEGIELLRNGTLVVTASLSNYTAVGMIVSVTEGNFNGPYDVSAVTTTKVLIEVRPDDYNEHAPVFGKVAYEASLEFSSGTGTEVKITNFRATDDDGHNVIYAIQTRNDRENLKIDSQTGKISVHIKFDDTVPEVIKLVIIATDESPYPKTGSCTVTIILQGYTQTKCVAANAYSQLQQQRVLFLGLFIAMAALLAVISIAAVFAIYKWRTVRRRTQYQENINTAHGKTTKSSEQAGYDSLAAGSKDEETSYNKLKDRDFSSGVPNPAYVSTGPRPPCTPPTDPVPDY